LALPTPRDVDALSLRGNVGVVHDSSYTPSRAKHSLLYSAKATCTRTYPVVSLRRLPARRI